MKNNVITKTIEGTFVAKITESWRNGKIELDGRLLDAGGRLVSPKHRYATARFEEELPQKEAIAAGACLMVSGRLRTAEASAVTPSCIRDAAVYVA